MRERDEWEIQKRQGWEREKRKRGRDRRDKMRDKGSE